MAAAELAALAESSADYFGILAIFCIVNYCSADIIQVDNNQPAKRKALTMLATTNQPAKLPTPADIFASQSASGWLQNALLSALNRDCVDAARDAELLARVLSAHCDSMLGR